MKVLKKGLDSGTLPRYSTRDMEIQDETWADIPDLAGYEVSTAGRVRKWITKKGRAFAPVHEGRKDGSGEIHYTLAGTEYTIDELMRWTFGEDAGEDFLLGHEPGERERDLSQYEINEIVLAEGYKPAHEVAEEFRIDSQRVRGLWDGTR